MKMVIKCSRTPESMTMIAFEMGADARWNERGEDYGGGGGGGQR